VQDPLSDIFQRLKTVLKEYESPFTPKFDLNNKCDLLSIKNIEIDGRRRKEVYFVGLNIQSKYVGFYDMLFYTNTALKDVFESELLKSIKDKFCFHIKELDTELETQITKVLKFSFKLYKTRG
jgi:hypothetical protein